jgi:hypothetical protein
MHEWVITYSLTHSFKLESRHLSIPIKTTSLLTK